MRNLAIAIALAALPALASAQQLQVGTLQLSGATNLNFGSSTFEDDFGGKLDTTTRNFGGEGFYYVTPSVGIGFSAAYQYQKQDDGIDSFEASTTTFGPAVTVHLPLQDRLAVFATGMLGRASMDLGGGNDADGWGFLIGGGLKIFPASFASIDLGLNYSRFGLDASGIDLTLSGVTVSGGFSFYFGAK